MTNTDVTSISELPRLLEQAIRDESPSAVAALFTEDGSFWIADDRTPTGAAASGKEEIEQLFAGWFGAVGLRLAIEEPTHSVRLDEERVLQSGVFARTIIVRETGDEIEERGGYVRLIKKLNGHWKYQVLSVVVLQAWP
ncbi:MAG: nuclear transport factor 2 family protein [Actinomycetota bacterium]|nr:nuclear transport factor 2 family protein [Actinomycetota bacterium]